METALPELELSTFLAGLFSTNLAETLEAKLRTTVLMPPNGAFRRFGLLPTTCLHPLPRPISSTLYDTAVIGVQYADPLIEDSRRTFATLKGSNLHIEQRSVNWTVFFAPSGGWPDMQAELYPRNMLTQTGVIHEVSDILIPRSVHLTVGKLVKAAKATTMTAMLVKAGLGWVLNGKTPPQGSRWVDMSLSGTGWTLLCPTDDVFKQIDLTDLYANEERLHAIVTLHLIPTSPAAHNTSLPLDNSATYSTLQSATSAYGDVLVRVLDSDGGTVLGIKGARGSDGAQDWARVLSWSRSTTGAGVGGVVQIDWLLVPYTPTCYEEYGATVAVAPRGVVIIVLFFLGVR